MRHFELWFLCQIAALNSFSHFQKLFPSLFLFFLHFSNFWCNSTPHKYLKLNRIAPISKSSNVIFNDSITFRSMIFSPQFFTPWILLWYYIYYSLEASFEERSFFSSKHTCCNIFNASINYYELLLKLTKKRIYSLQAQWNHYELYCIGFRYHLSFS